MAQSVELLLDERAEAAIRGQWDLLADAGLLAGRRPGPGHRPHVTLFAATAIPPESEPRLPELVASLDLKLWIGGLAIFGPSRGRVILVRQVLSSMALLRLQADVAVACQADPGGQFGPGRWSPHVTLSRRLPVDRVAEAITALDRTADRPLATRVTRCRRWDGTTSSAWLL